MIGIAQSVARAEDIAVVVVACMAPRPISVGIVNASALAFVQQCIGGTYRRTQRHRCLRTNADLRECTGPESVRALKLKAHVDRQEPCAHLVTDDRLHADNARADTH